MDIKSGNLNSLSIWPSQLYPYEPYNHHTWITTNSPIITYDFQIRKLENGFILTFKAKEYAFETMQALTEFLKEHEG